LQSLILYNELRKAAIVAEARQTRQERLQRPVLDQRCPKQTAGVFLPAGLLQQLRQHLERQRRERKDILRVEDVCWNAKNLF